MKHKAKLVMQPMAASVGTLLKRNEVAAFLANDSVIQARARYYARERLKIEKAIYRIKWVPVEKPGLIPQTLDEIRQVIARFRTEEQPRVGTLLDSVNLAVLKGKGLLANVNTSLGSVQGVFDYLAANSTYVKIGLGVLGGLILAILVMSLIVLIRLAIGL